MASKAKSTSKSATTEAASGVGARRTVSDAERDNIVNRQDQITDIGVDEATQSAVLDQTRSWNANVKRTYDTLEQELHASVMESNAHVSELRTVRLRMLTDMAVNADNLQKQHLAHRDIATDRTWNIDEVSALSAKSGVQADAMVTLLAKVIADALGTSK